MINRVTIGDTTHLINGIPSVSKLEINTPTSQYSGNTCYAPFYCNLVPMDEDNILILAIVKAGFLRQGVSLWTEMFLESRYFSSSTSTTTQGYGALERRTSPANTSANYELTFTDVLTIGSGCWRPIAYSGQPYKMNHMGVTLLLFGTNYPSLFELQNSLLSWQVN